MYRSRFSQARKSQAGNVLLLMALALLAAPFAFAADRMQSTTRPDVTRTAPPGTHISRPAQNSPQVAAFKREFASYQQKIAALQRDVERLQVQLRQLNVMAANMRSTRDGSQLMNMDLQNTLQRQQQTLQEMSRISKMIHNSSMNVIRKIGG
jgi:chromosome segregation ATPase